MSRKCAPKKSEFLGGWRKFAKFEPETSQKTANDDYKILHLNFPKNILYSKIINENKNIKYLLKNEEEEIEKLKKINGRIIGYFPTWRDNSRDFFIDLYDFDKLKFDENFDKFLYQRVGRNMLRLVTAGSFIRPYASVSLREYFATGFEAYYLGKRDTLERISPILYDKIEELHNLDRY